MGKKSTRESKNIILGKRGLNQSFDQLYEEDLRYHAHYSDDKLNLELADPNRVGYSDKSVTHILTDIYDIKPTGCSKIFRMVNGGGTVGMYIRTALSLVLVFASSRRATERYFKIVKDFKSKRAMLSFLSLCFAFL